MGTPWLRSTLPDPRLIRRAWVGALALLWCLPAAAERAEDLAALRARIEKLQTELHETRGERDTVRDQVRDAERQIDTLLRAMRQTRAREQNETRQLSNLEKSRVRLLAGLATRRDEMNAAVRSAYLSGQQDGLKLLLSQDDPGRASRMLVYARHIATSRVAQMTQLQQTLAQLTPLEAQITERRAALREAQADQKREQQELKQARGERQQALASLNKEVRNRAQEIERARRDAERLTRLMQELNRLPSAAPPPPPGPSPVGRGRWPLPVAGTIVARYGQTRSVGDLRWRGIFLASAEGRPVRAPARARVVYADWLRGFGLLVILDHGAGLMTLYGHNQSLHKALGDTIEAGETIALTGSTGGPAQPGLYFEVRERGEPRDPLDWCKL